jgi:uncharacterized protein YqgQ
MPTIYDVARDLKTAGVEVSAHINPAKLTVRMRNNIKRMLTTGIMKGSYYSHAARIAKIITKDHTLSHVRQQYGYTYFKIHRAFNAQERELITDLINTDKMLTRVADSDNSYRKEWAENYYKESMNTLKLNLNLEFAVSFRINNEDLRKQVQELISKIKTPEEIELRKQLCAKFDSNELIPIEIAI